MKKIAVFDIDNTVISNDSWVGFVAQMVKRSKFGFFCWIYIYWTGFLYMCHILPIEKVKNKWLKLISDMDEQTLDDYCRDYVVQNVLPFIKTGVKDEIQRLRAEGFTIVFATASLECYAKYIAEDFGADIFVGTRLVRMSNHYEVVGKNCKKHEKIVRILQKIDISDIDLVNSVSFSDSLSDLPFLDITGAFNLVDKHHWRVIEVRRAE